jgi:hypothetical protein
MPIGEKIAEHFHKSNINNIHLLDESKGAVESLKNNLIVIKTIKACILKQRMPTRNSRCIYL